MDFYKVLKVAASKKDGDGVQKRYSLAVGPPKKDPKVKGVHSAAVQAFLKKKEEEIRQKELEEKRRKEELLAKRKELNHDKKARAMASRTKDNFRGYNGIPVEEKPKKRNSSPERDQNANVMDAEDDECMEEEELYEYSQTESEEEEIEEPPPKKIQQPLKKKPPPAALNFADLLKLAEKKQFEPVEIVKPLKKNDERPRTAEEIKELEFLERKTQKSNKKILEREPKRNGTIVKVSKSSESKHSSLKQSNSVEIKSKSHEKKSSSFLKSTPTDKTNISGLKKTSGGDGREYSNMTGSHSKASKVSVNGNLKPMSAKDHKHSSSSKPDKMGNANGKYQGTQLGSGSNSIRPSGGSGSSRPTGSSSSAKPSGGSNSNTGSRPAQPSGSSGPNSSRPSSGSSSSRPSGSSGSSSSRPLGSSGSSSSRPLGSSGSSSSRPLGSSGSSSSRPLGSSASSSSRPLGSSGSSTLRPSGGLGSSSSRPSGGLGSSSARPPACLVSTSARPSGNSSSGAPRRDSSGLSNNSAHPPSISGSTKSNNGPPLSKSVSSRPAPGSTQVRPNGGPGRPLNNATVGHGALPKPKCTVISETISSKNFVPKSSNGPVNGMRAGPVNGMRAGPLPGHRPMVRPPGPPKPPITISYKRRLEDEEEDYDSEMEDFIDDGGESQDEISRHIREIFGYDRNKYKDESDYALRYMETSFREQQKEEARSLRLGIQEDLEELRREEEELKQKAKKEKSAKRLKT